MKEKNKYISAGNETPDHSEREIPFDATTNFSLLGWLWDKFNKAKSSKKLIDLSLEE
jgi:hypothetical protein